jgi:hypothetical protein
MSLICLDSVLLWSFISERHSAPFPT